MKGVVFTEFLDHVDAHYGLHVAEEIIEANELESCGHYTAVGTYKCSELMALVGALSEETGKQAQELVHRFGVDLADTFRRQHPGYFDVTDYFDFIESIDSRIHVEVRKLYPDAELPRFDTVRRTDEALVVDYVSNRALEALACGLLVGSAKHFGDIVDVTMAPVVDSETRIIRLTIRRL